MTLFIWLVTVIVLILCGNEHKCIHCDPLFGEYFSLTGGIDNEKIFFLNDLEIFVVVFSRKWSGSFW